MTYVKCPQIDAYHSTDAIPSRSWVAMFRDNEQAPGQAKTVSRHLPINFWSASRDGAVAAAAAWWANEQEKRARAAELAVERAERMRRNPARKNGVVFSEPERAE